MVILPLNLFSGDLNPHVFSYPSLHYYQLGLLYGFDFLLQWIAHGADLFDWIASRYFIDASPLRDAARWLSVAYAVGTVALTAMIAGRLSTARCAQSAAGLFAAALMAVNAVHVRQAPLAAVDTPLAFWFAAAVFASIRLLQADGRRDYVLAGLLVGAAAATKYPGVTCCIGVVAAHMLSRRRLLDARLWLAGAVSAATFVVLSPYVLFDFETFSRYFLMMAANAEAGRFGIEAGPLFHLGSGLQHGVGALAWVVWLVTCGWAVYTRDKAHLVVLVTVVGLYVTISWGDLVFLRYVLPLLPLQAAVIGDGASRSAKFLRNRLPAARPDLMLPLAAALLLAQPLLASARIAKLSARQDTRTMARHWFEQNVAAGASLCNFGGWPGDMQVRTYEDQWWRLREFLAVWPHGSQKGLAQAIAPQDPKIPFYTQAVRNNNRDMERGSVALIHQRQCAYVVTHEHPLPYSEIDPAFRRQLADEATMVARFDPEVDAAAVFDNMDGYYVPVSGFGAQRPGPVIEIWSTTYVTPPEETSQRHVFSRVLSQMAANAVNDGDLPAAAEAVRAAYSLDPGNDHAVLVEAKMFWDQGDTTQARIRFGQMLQLNPGLSVAMDGLAGLAVGRGDTAQAIQWMQEVCRLRPRDTIAQERLAALRRH